MEATQYNMGNMSCSRKLWGPLMRFELKPHRHSQIMSQMCLTTALCIKGPCCFLEQETLPLLLSTGWFQERNRA